MIEEPRIGVFVCHCGINIGGYVDVPDVVEYSTQLTNVVYAEPNLYTCSSEGLQKIKEAIKKHHLNRVVVASCTPRTHEPLFQSACEEAGLNKYMFEMANIRDQCSWVHMHEPEKATQKAKDLVRMAVAKARLLVPETEPEIDIIPESLVIGGGVSGLTAALSLIGQGFKVHLVEKKDQLGGNLLNLDTLFPSNINAIEVLQPLLEKVYKSTNITVHLNSKIIDVKGFIGNFDVTIETIEGLQKLNVGTIIVATGAEYLSSEELQEHGLGTNVISQLQLEQMFKEGANLERIKTLVMIQCIGSRIEKRPYCSRICCTEAMKNALKLKELDVSRDIYILYRDLQTYGSKFYSIEHDSKNRGIKLIKYEKDKPPELTFEGNKTTVEVYSPLLRETLRIEADMVILSAAMVPNRDNKDLSKYLKVPIKSDGFFMEAHVKLRPIDFATDGIYLCGTAQSPKEVAESIAQAKGAASRAGIPMAKGRLKTAAITSEVDEKKCSGCGTCIELCAYNAITKNERGLAQVMEAVCKGCGVCGASCPEQAINMRHFTNAELEAQGLAAIKEV